MFRNYLKVAIRNLVRRKAFSLLNIFGLAIGMACSILIFLWVQDELSYDKFNANANTIYRITCNVTDVKAAVIPIPMAPALQKSIPAIKAATRVSATNIIFSIGNKKFEEKHAYYADSNFLQIFNYPLVAGNKNTVLHNPDGMLITEDMAKKYFGNEQPIGKVIRMDNDITNHDLIVEGVLKNIPGNSHLQFDMLLPWNRYANATRSDSWGNFDVYAYVQLDEHFAPTPAALKQLEQRMDDIHERNDETHTRGSFFLQPVTGIHLHSDNLLLDVEGQGSIEYVTIFSLVAIFILVIACINFMNLSTALASQRAKEVGLRKTIGALKFQLVAQFMGEALLLSLIALIIAIGLTYLLLPAFNTLASKTISLNLLNTKIISGLLGTALLTGLIAGSYPAFYLARFQPVKVLKGLKIQGKGNMLRGSLVVLQFTVSIVLIISTLVVYNQLQFIRNRDIGFKKDNLLYIQMPQVGDLRNNTDALKAILNQTPGITNYTIINHLPTNLTTGTTTVGWPGKDPHQEVVVPHIAADENFIKTFGMQMLAGRPFNKLFATDEKGYMVNETALKLMKLTPANAIGKQIMLNDDTGQIIGVVKDFNFKAVHQAIEPLIIRYNHEGGFLVLRANSASIGNIISETKNIFQRVFPNYPFTYSFVDEDIAKLYTSEQQMGKLFNVFSVLSIIVSCLGLFGLATFATQKRVKEIGVRKVLGASVTGIVSMLSKDFLKLVAISSVIAFPVAWWAMHQWLQNFAYHAAVSWWIFLLAAVLAVAIALATISFQAIKAARMNPTKSLRSE